MTLISEDMQDIMSREIRREIKERGKNCSSLTM